GNECVGTRESGPPDEPRPLRPQTTRSRTARQLLRLGVSWLLALALLGIGLPAVLARPGHVVLPVLAALRWPAVAALVVVWFLGKYVHSFLLTAAAPGLSRPRA